MTNSWRFPQPTDKPTKKGYKKIYSIHKIYGIVVLLLFSFVIGSCRASDVPTNATVPDRSLAAENLVIERISPLAVEKASAPVLMRVPDLDFEVRVTPMGWVVTDVAGQRTTKWVIPTISVGWHVNSAGTGAAGNTVLSGHQAVGDAVFAPLALGEIKVDQQVLLTAEDGTVYIYRIAEVSEPIAVTGATEEDKAAAAAYVADSKDAKLTLVTGWPDFSTTHRIFAVAEFVGRAQSQ